MYVNINIVKDMLGFEEVQHILLCVTNDRCDRLI